MNIFKSARGFTLIELLVVIAIIGILSSIVLASLNSARLKSRDARRIADIKQIQLALQLYYDGNGSVYPAALSNLTTPTAYIPTIPTDPIAQVPYLYEHFTGPETYHLAAELEDSTNPSFNSDADTDTTVIKGADDTKDCAGATTTRYCYDVTQ